MSPPDIALLARIAANAVAVGRRGRQDTGVGPFRAFLSVSSRDYFMSFAVPAPPGAATTIGWAADDWARPITALVDHFSGRCRTCRLEYFAELHPRLAVALAAAGLSQDKSAPAMAVTPACLRPRPPGRDMTMRLLRPGDTVAIKRFMAVQSEGFGVDIDTGPNGWRPILEAGLSDGTMIAALGQVDGRACCGAVIMIGGGAAELAGVSTVPAYRRRGLAADLCSRLLARYFDGSDAPAWLSADGEIAEELYGELGFRTVGLQLNYGVPRDPDGGRKP